MTFVRQRVAVNHTAESLLVRTTAAFITVASWLERLPWLLDGGLRLISVQLACSCVTSSASLAALGCIFCCVLPDRGLNAWLLITCCCWREVHGEEAWVQSSSMMRMQLFTCCDSAFERNSRQ
jgi:hypothetical protein